MNKKTLIKQATLLLTQYEDLMSETRNYDNCDWHCVNVKRYNDFINIEALIKTFKIDYRERLTKEFNNDNFHFDVYNFWLESLWDQLNYDLQDIEEITESCKDFHKSFKFIEKQKDGKFIYSLGRSGGWACFQDNMDDNIEDILTAVIDWDIEAMNYNDINIDYEKDLFDNVIVKFEEIEAMFKEVEYIKNYINKFNKDAEFIDEVKFQMEEKIEEYKFEDKEIAENKTRFKTDIMAYSNTMQNRLDSHKKHKELKNNITRHLTGIIKALKD